MLQSTSAMLMRRDASNPFERVAEVGNAVEAGLKGNILHRKPGRLQQLLCSLHTVFHHKLVGRHACFLLEQL